MEYIKNAIVYQGNKYKLLDKILPLLPENINTFIDVFCGSGTMGLNVLHNNLAKDIIFNDLNAPIINILKKTINETDDLLWEIEYNITNHNLRKTFKDTPKEEQELAKISYITFRKYVNSLTLTPKQKASYDFILHLFSFNSLIRFNQKEKFNASFGFSTARDPKIAKEYLKKMYNLDKEKIIFFNSDFLELFKANKTTLNNNDFIYVDPPYLNTTAVYNENRLTGWKEEDEDKLLKMLDIMDKGGIKFGMSNTFSGKCGTHNEKLKKWAEKYETHYFDKNYNVFGHSNKKI